MKYAGLILAGVALLAGADVAGFGHWKAAELKSYQQKLAPKINEKKVANETIGKFGNHALMMVHREGPGNAELHQTQADLFIAQSGEATIVVGGTMVDPVETAPNELQGASIQGGEKRKIAPGDIVHIPAKVPHQVLVDSGKQFTYAIMKIDSN